MVFCAMQCYARLVGAHKTAVTKLVSVGGKEPGSPDALVSAAADGTIAYWQPSLSAAGQGFDTANTFVQTL